MSDDDTLGEFHRARSRKFIEFGEVALCADSVAELLQLAVANVAEGLETDYAKVLVPTKTGELLIIAGVGWNEGDVGSKTISGSLNSAAGYALETGKPVRSSDLSVESRFNSPPFLLEHDIKSAVNVLIQVDGTAFGVLEVDSPDVRDFSIDDVVFLQGYSQLLAAAIHRTRHTEQLQAMADEKTVLLNELHHRIANDLQLMTSLINFRKRATTNTHAADELDWVSNRLNSLSQLHAHLRKSGSATVVELHTYIGSICSELAQLHQFEANSVTLETKLDKWMVRATDAVSFGLIINEFVSNSLEHAVGDTGGKLEIHLITNGDTAKLIIADSGPGFTHDPASSRSGLGLMQTLAKSVGTEVNFSTDDGVRLELQLSPQPG